MEVLFNNEMPQYRVKILKIYESCRTLRHIFKYMSFLIKGKTERIKKYANIKNFKTNEELVKIFEEKNVYFTVDSIFHFKRLKELNNVYDKILDFTIIKLLKKTCMYSTRPFYKGKYKRKIKKEWLKDAENLFNKNGLTESYINKIKNKFL